MKLPGPLRYLTLIGSLSLAAPALAMGVISISNGDPWIGGVYLAVGLFVFALPEYIERKLPGPREVVRAHRPRPVAAAKRRLFGGAGERTDGAEDGVEDGGGEDGAVTEIPIEEN